MWRSVRGFITGVVLLLLALEVVLRLLPVSTATRTGYHVDPKILGYPPGHVWQVSTGWDLRNPQVLRANQLGVAADHEFTFDPNAIAVIGDSYVEASMLPAADRPAAQLQRLLSNGRRVYGLGAPGTALLDYAERIRFARERTGARDVVVLMEAGDIRQALCGSGNVHYACLDAGTLKPREVPLAGPAGLKVLARESALAQYLWGQLKIDPQRLIEAMFTRAVPQEPQAKPTASPSVTSPAEPNHVPSYVKAVAQRFIERARSHVPGRLIIVVDGERPGSPTMAKGLQAERQAFMRLARDAGLSIVDAEPLYRAYAVVTPWPLEVGPYDQHLNARGVKVLMEAAASLLQQP